MLRYFSGYKSLPCRGACGCGGCGAAGGGVSASGTGCAPINTLGGWARSMSRCLFRRLFLRSRSFTPWNIAPRRWENSNRHYTAGIVHLVSGAQDGAGGAMQCVPMNTFICMATTHLEATGAARVGVIPPVPLRHNS